MHSKYKDNNKNENVASLTEKAKVITFFRSVGFADWFVGLKGYSKFAPFMKRNWSVKTPWKLLVPGNEGLNGVVAFTVIG